jgi:hypothetical protein
MTTGMIRIAVVFVLAMASAAPAINQSAPTPIRQLSADHAVFTRLHTLVLVHFHRTAFNTAIKSLAKAAGVDVFVDWHTLAQASIRRGTPVTLHLNGPVPARTVLSLVITQLSPGGQRLAFTVSRGVLFLGSLQEVEKRRLTRIYAPFVSQAAPVGSWQYNAQNQQLDQIVRLLENNIDRNRWIANGGIDASATVFNGALVITADEVMQRKIEKLLQNLAEAQAATAANP